MLVNLRKRLEQIAFDLNRIVPQENIGTIYSFVMLSKVSVISFT